LIEPCELNIFKRDLFAHLISLSSRRVRTGRVVTKTTSAPLFMNRYSGLIFATLCMHTDCAEVDELLLELADYKNDYADMTAANFYGSANQLGSCSKLTVWFKTW